jgi:hypothetical protein
MSQEGHGGPPEGSIEEVGDGIEARCDVVELELDE